MDLADQHIPAWMEEIKAEARGKIISSGFASACRQGDTVVMRGLVTGLWPFVNEFPRSIINGIARLKKIGLGQDRALLNTLLYRGPEVLSGIQRDEKNHRKLWLETGRALGLNYPLDYDQPVLPETQAWIDAVNANSDPSALFLRFTAVEIIAEAVSVDFLASRAFTEALGEKGCEWFRVHAEHGSGMSHEELELRLAFAFLRGEATKEYTNSVIQRIVDHFVAAGNSCARLARENRTNRPLT